MWKNDRFFEERGKAFTPKIAAALLKDGKAKVKGLRSMKTGKTYDGTVLLADTGGKYVNYRVEQRGKTKTASIGSVATLPENLDPAHLPGRDFLFGEAPNPYIM